MKKRVLIVEDEIIVAMDLQVILTDLGYEVPDILTSGEAAVQRSLELHPDLILMDIHLSEELDGITAASLITQELDIPIVYLTAYADEETLKRARQTTPFGYILKPFEPKELRANLEIAFYKHGIEQNLKENRQWLLAVLNSISEAVVASDNSGKIQFMNPVAEILTGWRQEEAIDKHLTDVFHLIHEMTRHPVENPILKALREGRPVELPENTLLRSKAGDKIPIADSASPIIVQQGKVHGAVMVFRDISEQKRHQAQLEYNALHDPLTHLPNRVLFMDRLQRAVDRARRNPGFGFAVMLLDLDRFKVINDTLGHFLGDQLLVAIAPRFKAHLRGVDTVARLGGDEFAILIEDVRDATRCCRTAQRILDELQRPFRVDGHELLVTASIGIVLSSIPYEQAADLLQDADIAMYRAKAQGRGRYELFDGAMHEQAKMYLHLEHDLRQAIAYQEFQVYYQPVLSLTSQQVVSLEALVRWQNQKGALVGPAEFIPLAEEIGLVTAIDQWVLWESCRQLQAWQHQIGHHIWTINDGGASQLLPAISSEPAITVSVNFSSRQFPQHNLMDTFARILQETGLAGNSLKLEVTESVFIENAELAASALSQLRSLGVQICLDDFGTGYSSLSYLHKFPIDGVKIDRSFIQGLETDGEKLEIVRAIVGLCQNLGLVVTAEGIETVAQAEILRDLGCEYGQGYLFAPPADSNAIATRLRSTLN